MEPDSFSRLILILAAGSIGASIGSFVNVCVYRIPIGLTVTRPRRSFCPHCRHQVEARDNIPVVSWLWLRGKCRYCKSSISVWYFLIELLCGAGTAIAFVQGGFAAAAGFLLLFSLLCLALRMKHSKQQPAPLLLIGLAFAACFLLLVRRPTMITTPAAVLMSLAAGLVMTSRWGVFTETDWQQRLVVICATLVSGALISWSLVLLFALIRQFRRSPQAFAGTFDLLILTGVCVGSLMKF